MASQLLVPLLFFVNYDSLVIVDRVDLIEVNHFIDDKGQYCFSQFIFWDFNNEMNRYEVVEWRLNRKILYPRKCYISGFYILNLFEKENLVLRVVKSRSFKETVTSNDPERDNREILPETKRRGLKKIDLQK